MSFQSEIEIEIVLIEKIREYFLGKKYESEDVNKIIDYINDTITLISDKITMEGSHELSENRINIIKEELNTELDILYTELNKKLEKHLPIQFKRNVSEDFISNSIKEITFPIMQYIYPDFLPNSNLTTKKVNDELYSQIIYITDHRIINNYSFWSDSLCKLRKTEKDKPLYLLIYGKPGTGKTLNIKYIKEIPLLFRSSLETVSNSTLIPEFSSEYIITSKKSSYNLINSDPYYFNQEMTITDRDIRVVRKTERKLETYEL